MNKLILSLALVLASFGAHAVGGVTGAVTDNVPNSAGTLSVRTSGTASGQPSCASANPGWFVIDITSAGGQQMASSIRFASALGRTVTLVGTGACSGSIEILEKMSVAP